MDKKFFAKKRLGQNFLTSQSYLQGLIDLLDIKKCDHIVEIGPGKGALTQHLLSHVARYDAIEIDRDLIPLLQKKFNTYSNFYLHTADALTFDFTSLHQNQSMRFIGNLPYNISSIHYTFKTRLYSPTWLKKPLPIDVRL
jgi:16S rRNA (adenine1518-N6/adenine1519-N6)-dimethyltransferase